jgi:hypothetical protein
VILMDESSHEFDIFLAHLTIAIPIQVWVESDRVMCCCALDQVRFSSHQTSIFFVSEPYIYDLVRSNELDRIGFVSDACLSHVDFILISIKLNFFYFSHILVIYKNFI